MGNLSNGGTMTLSPADVFDLVKDIHGFLYPAEVHQLYALACEIPQGGTVVELGCYQGKSTTALAYGVQAQAGNLYTIDPFEGEMVGNIEVKREFARQVMQRLTDRVLDTHVQMYEGYSYDIVKTWQHGRIDLLFIDAVHDYESVSRDLADWSPLMADGGRIALHDHNSTWPGVQLAVAEFITRHNWRIISQVEGLVTLERNTTE
jgi:predicted O-methyltransferase YrrM